MLRVALSPSRNCALAAARKLQLVTNDLHIYKLKWMSTWCFDCEAELKTPAGFKLDSRYLPAGVLLTWYLHYQNRRKRSGDSTIR